VFVPKEIAQNIAMLIPAVRAYARRHHKNTGITNDAAEAERVYREFTAEASVAGKDILELGPGQTALLLQRSLREGARSATGLDVADYFGAGSPAGVRLVFYTGRRMPFPDAAFDVVWANACFEHLRYPELTVSECARVLRRGGSLITAVDLKDHYHSAPELAAEHLRYPDWLWRAMTWNRSAFTNRVRASTWLEIFARNGLRERTVRTEVSPALRAAYPAHPARATCSESDFVTTLLFASLEKQ
jgi:SAM-dependent methyltransferase